MLTSPFYRFPARRGGPSLMDIAMRQLDEMSEMAFDQSSSTTREPGYSYNSDENSVNIQVELPGVAPANLEVHAEAGKVLVRGKRFSKRTGTTVEQVDEQNGKKAQKEGNSEVKQEPVPEVVFVKEFHVPQSIDTDETCASFKDGLLELCIPKKQQHATRRIKIDASS